MAISRYLKPGATFGPEAIAEMGKAFEGAVAALAVEHDEEKREAVAQFIILLCRWDARLDAKALRDRTVAALGGLEREVRKRG